MTDTWKDSKANQRQVGADHYKNGGEEHWDRVFRLKLDYFQGQITKYVERCWDKNGIEDLEKAHHFLEKYIEVCKATGRKPKAKEMLFEWNFKKPDPEMLGIGDLDVRQYKDGEVLTTGWAQFVFEGTNDHGNLFTCRECNEHFHAPVDQNPHGSHKCHELANECAESNITGGAEATKAYINQG